MVLDELDIAIFKILYIIIFKLIYVIIYKANKKS